jgi:hypothetical protein
MKRRTAFAPRGSASIHASCAATPSFVPSMPLAAAAVSLASGIVFQSA